MMMKSRTGHQWSGGSGVVFQCISGVTYVVLKHRSLALNGELLRDLASSVGVGTVVTMMVKSSTGRMVAVPLARVVASGKHEHAVLEAVRVLAQVGLSGAVMLMSPAGVLVPAVMHGASSFLLDEVVDRSSQIVKFYRLFRSRL